MSINTIGYYIIEFSAPGFSTFISNTIQISALSLHSISVTSSVSSISAFKKFIVNAKLYDQRNRLWTSNSRIDLISSTNIGGVVTGTSSSGSFDFEIYAKVSGNLAIELKSSGISGFLNIHVEKLSLLVNLKKPKVKFI